LKWLRHVAVYWAVSIALGAVFVYASYEKIKEPRAFAKIVYHYQLAGPSASLGFLPPNLLAALLPWTELVVGVLLIVGVWRREAAVLAALMLVMFLVAVSWALANGIDLANCGCFSVSEGQDGRAVGLKLILGDLGLLLAAVYVAAWPPLRLQAAPLNAPAAVH
jgi:uncharacterized membrane protein YphA (DoxX/SURF4 family)